MVLTTISISKMRSVIPALVHKFVEAVDDRQERIVVWGSGTPTRDFVYAGDVAEGLLRTRKYISNQRS